jgi:sterol desaturase/sphingolipid hydroxylase (fatty acid hydroxylase superfamily)
VNLETYIIDNETTVRLSAFFTVFSLMALWELWRPCRVARLGRGRRWFNNLTLVVVNALVLRLLFPAATVGVALYAQQDGWGLFNHLSWPPALETLLALVLLDLAIYLQHVMFHAVPLFWRFHRVHHADLDYDVTTGARFHPLEIILSMLIKFAVILLLGPSLLAVILFEVILNAMAMFNHSNISLPARLDRLLRWFVVTPDMHRVHHSIEDDEANSNFGFNLSWWDRLLGTYTRQPRHGHRDMVIGIRGFRDVGTCVSLPRLLLIPFAGKPRGYTLNRRWSDDGS